MNTPDNWITAAQAAELAGVVPATIARWVKEGLLVPAHQAPGVRGARYFDRGAFLAMLDAERPRRAAALRRAVLEAARRSA